MDCEAFRDRMLDVLYEEAEPAVQAEVAAHADVCRACREELDGLRALRVTLSSWKVPHLPRTVRRMAPPRYFWAAAAAALVAVGVGGALSLAGAEVSWSRGPMSVTLGRGKAPAPQLVSQPAPVEPVRPVTAALSALPAQPPAASIDEAALMRRIDLMIRQSEARQRAAYTASLVSFEQQTTRQRRYDLARIGAGLSYLDGKSSQHLARTTELMGYMLQTSNRREP